MITDGTAACWQGAYAAVWVCVISARRTLGSARAWISFDRSSVFVPRAVIVERIPVPYASIRSIRDHIIASTPPANAPTIPITTQFCATSTTVAPAGTAGQPHHKRPLSESGRAASEDVEIAGPGDCHSPSIFYGAQRLELWEDGG